MTGGQVKKNSLTAVIFTVIITIGMGLAILEVLKDPEKKPVTGKGELESIISSNERAALANLKCIYMAQEKYKTLDVAASNRSGRSKYAAFFVHLWTSVTVDGEPVRVGLIPKEMAFSMDAASSINGYYFRDLRSREDNGGRRRDFDYTKEWSVAAIPAEWGKTGNYSFMVDQTGQVYRTNHHAGEGPYTFEARFEFRE